MGRPRAGASEICTRCGVKVYRPPSQRERGRPFCSRQCHMATLNEELNPTRMTPEVKSKLRDAKIGTGAGETYPKFHGRNEHRTVAEWILGRPLKVGEVVHHVDGNKRNNDPQNLMVFSSQGDHAAWHNKHDKGGDAK